MSLLEASVALLPRHLKGNCNNSSKKVEAQSCSGTGTASTRSLVFVFKIIEVEGLTGTIYNLQITFKTQDNFIVSLPHISLFRSCNKVAIVERTVNCVLQQAFLTAIAPPFPLIFFRLTISLMVASQFD